MSGPSLYVKRRGRGPLLLLIAGLGLDHNCFVPLLPHLQRHFHCLTYDHPGVGRSASLAEPVTLSSLSACARGVLAEATPDPAFVLGVSLGGMVALDLAARHPQAVRKLILVSSTHRETPQMARVLALWRQALSHLGREEFLKLFTLTALSPAAGEKDRREIDALLRGVAQAAPAPDVLEAQMAILEGLDLTEEAQQIRCPVLLVGAERDSLIPPAHVEDLAGLLPLARYKIVPQAGHNLIWEEPKLVAALVREFLS
jgi:3-oxoadipate enol-lactonase